MRCSAFQRTKGRKDIKDKGQKGHAPELVWCSSPWSLRSLSSFMSFMPFQCLRHIDPRPDARNFAKRETKEYGSPLFSTRPSNRKPEASHLSITLRHKLCQPIGWKHGLQPPNETITSPHSWCGQPPSTGLALRMRYSITLDAMLLCFQPNRFALAHTVVFGATENGFVYSDHLPLFLRR